MFSLSFYICAVWNTDCRLCHRPRSFSWLTFPCTGKKKTTRWFAVPWQTPRWPITLLRGVRGNLSPRIWRLWPTPRQVSQSEMWSASTIGSVCTAQRIRGASPRCRRNSLWKCGQVPALVCFLLGVGASIDLRLLFSLVHLSMLVTQAAGLIGSPSLKIMPAACKFFISQSSYYMTGPWLAQDPPPAGWVYQGWAIRWSWGQSLNLLTSGHPKVS